MGKPEKVEKMSLKVNVHLRALTDLTLWSHDNNIQFNASTCKVMSITRKRRPALGEFFLGPD